MQYVIPKPNVRTDVGNNSLSYTLKITAKKFIANLAIF